MAWPKQKPIRYVPPLYGPNSYTGKAAPSAPTKYTLEVLDDVRWRVTCPDLSTFNTSTFDEVLDFLRHHTQHGY